MGGGSAEGAMRDRGHMGIGDAGSPIYASGVLPGDGNTLKTP